MIEKRYDLLSKKWVPIDTGTREEYLARKRWRPDEDEARGQGHQILDTIASGIIAVNLEGKVTIFNRRAEEIIRVRADEFMGKELESIPSALSSLLLETLKTGKTYHRKEVHIIPENILVGVSTSQFYNFRGEVLGAAMVFADLLKIKGAEYSLSRKKEDEFWKKFAHCLAHEIKNPLVSINTFAQLLPRYQNGLQFKENFLTEVNNDIQRLNKFLEKLITISLPLELNLQTRDIEEALKEALSCLRDTNYPQGISLDWKRSNLPFVSFDSQKLKEALENILRNAIEAMPKGGALALSASLANEDFVEIRLQDTGEGIAAQDLPQIFLPFFTTKDGHSGLGLTLAKRIIEAHGGFIEAKSKVGAGSIFSIFLPIPVENGEKIKE